LEERRHFTQEGTAIKRSDRRRLPCQRSAEKISIEVDEKKSFVSGNAQEMHASSTGFPQPRNASDRGKVRGVAA
jgi:hypothetical protein